MIEPGDGSMQNGELPDHELPGSLAQVRLYFTHPVAGFGTAVSGIFLILLGLATAECDLTWSAVYGR